MKSRGGDRPDEGPDERRDPRAKTRRWGRGRAAEAEPEEPVAGEEFGWIDDLRSAKQQRGELGPDGAPAEPNRPHGGPPEPAGPRRGAPAEPPGPRTGVAPEPGGPRRGTPAEPSGPRTGGPPEPAGARAPVPPPGPRQSGPDGGAAARRPVDTPWPGNAPPVGRRPDDRPSAAGPAAPGQPARRGVQPAPGARAAVPPAPPAARPVGGDPASPPVSRATPEGPGGPPRPRSAAAPPGPPVGPPTSGAPTGRRPEAAVPPGRRPDAAAAGGHPDAMPPLRRPDAGAPGRRPGPESAEPGRARPPAEGMPAGRRTLAAPDPARAAGPSAASGSAQLAGTPAGAAVPAADGLRPDPAIDRDPRTARRRPGPVDPGAPEPTDGRPAERSRPAAGRRRAAEPDEPPVPRTGNAPPVPRATGAHSGATPTVAPPDGTGRRRAVSAEPERRTPPGGEPRADRPERPADWLRQAGRLPHTDPGLPVVNRRGGTPPAADRRPAPADGAGDLVDHASGRLGVPDPAAERTAARRPAGPPADPGADAPTGRRAVRADAPGTTGEQAPPHAPAAGDRPTRGRGAAAPVPDPSGGRARPVGAPGPGADPTPDPSGRRRRPPVEPGTDGPGRPGPADDPYAGGRQAPGAGPAAPTRGAARSAPPGRARPVPGGAAAAGGAPVPGAGRRGADAPPRPAPGTETAPRDVARPDGPARAAVAPGGDGPVRAAAAPAVDGPPRTRPDGPARAAVRPPGGAQPPLTDDRAHGDPGSGPGSPARGGAPVGRAVPTDRAAGRALPPHRDPGRADPSGVAPVPPPGRSGEPVGVARAAAAVPVPAGPVDRPAADPADGPALRAAGPDTTDDDAAPGARSELRRRLRERRRLRAAVLVLVSVVLLGAVPLFFGVRTLSRDPVFDNLDQLDVPGWAAAKTVDDVSGSRWCLLDCRLRERTVTSDKPPTDTARVYEDALRQDGWQPWKVSRCPEQKTKGSYTCWRRDELTLDLWVREPTCVPPPVDGEPAVVPSGDPSAAATECTGSLVSVKVRNAIDDERTRPQPTTDPSLTGEDPFPTVSGDPLGELTPSPS